MLRCSFGGAGHSRVLKEGHRSDEYALTGLAAAHAFACRYEEKAKKAAPEEYRQIKELLKE